MLLKLIYKSFLLIFTSICRYFSKDVNHFYINTVYPKIVSSSTFLVVYITSGNFSVLIFNIAKYDILKFSRNHFNSIWTFIAFSLSLFLSVMLYCSSMHYLHCIKASIFWTLLHKWYRSFCIRGIINWAHVEIDIRNLFHWNQINFSCFFLSNFIWYSRSNI